MPGEDLTRKTEANLYGNEQRIIGPIRLPIFPAVDARTWNFLDLGWVDVDWVCQSGLHIRASTLNTWTSF
jgi:hypothetical protein